MFPQLEPYQEKRLPDNQIKHPIHCHMEYSPPMNRIANPHFHDAIELLYSFSGSTRVFVSGQSFIMEPGDLMIINSNEVHAIYAEEGDHVTILFSSSVPKFSTQRRDLCLNRSISFLLPCQIQSTNLT